MSKRSNRRRIQRKPGTSDTTVFTISRLAFMVVPVILMTWLILMALSPYFAPALAIPALVVWWFIRLRTEVGPAGISATTLRGTTSAPWEDIAGLQFPKWTAAEAVRTDGSSFTLPAIGFNDLPYLSEASGGRLPDPFAAAAAARRAAIMDDDEY